MGRIVVAPGASVKVRSTGLTGKVLSLTKEQGQRGRPKTYAAIVLDDSFDEVSIGVRELTLL